MEDLKIINADNLLYTTLTESEFIVDEILPVGLHIFCGAPKVGKSWLMLDLCNELKISVNELLCGELIEMNNYNEVAEKTLLEMAQKEEMQNKKLMMYENVIGFSSTISFLILIFVTSFLVENNIAKIVLFILAFVLLIIGVSFALKIETETGYYECQKCHHKYVPKYSQVYFAMHSGTTRYMKCPKCNKKSWQRKTLSK